ncbi:unnamed protein product [Closterium sp. Yama58-4]|nr:unnamed protein product [Closterium sp. Yama58-4]
MAQSMPHTVKTSLICLSVLLSSLDAWTGPTRVAWLIGWALILEYTVGGAAVARGISPNLATALGGAGSLPFILARLPVSGTSVVLDPCAAITVALVTALLSAGIKESANFQMGMTIANVIILLFVAVAGAWIGFTHGWPGYKESPRWVVTYLPFGVSGLLGGAAMAFFSYIGFDTVASTAEEVKHPQRDLPLGIGLSLTCCGALYMVIAAVLVGLTPFDCIDPDTPMAQAFDTYQLDWAKYLVTGGALAALSTTLLGSLLPQPRILMVMARDGLLPAWFGRIDKATGVPQNATAVTGLLAAAMAFVLDIGQLSHGLSAAAMAFVLDIEQLSGMVGLGEGEDGIRLASRAIVAVSLGAPLLAAAAAVASSSADLSITDNWLPLLLFSLGGPLFLGGAATLGCINEDDGRHQFGSAGGFHCPWVPWLPLASILVNVYLMANLGATTWLYSSSWLAIGALVYLAYGICHSALGATTWLYSSSWLAIGALVYLAYGIRHSALGQAHAPGPRVLDASKRTASWWNLGTPFEEWVVQQTHRQAGRQRDTGVR